MDFNISLENNIVLLRPMRKEDFHDFQNLTTNKSMWNYFASDLSNTSELENWVDSAVRANINKTRLAFTIIYKPENKIIGSTSFGNLSEKDNRIEIGWTWLGKDYQGRRLNDQIKYLMLQYCFEEIEMKRVEFKTDVLNQPARMALKRIGAIEEGILRSHTQMIKDRRRDTIYYSILQPEWETVKNNLITSIT